MRATIVFLLRATISLALLFAVAATVDTTGVRGLLAQASIPWLALAMVILLLQVLVASGRWQRLIEKLAARRYRLGQLAAWMGVASMFGQILPSTVGGDVFRLALLGREQGLAMALRTILADRILGLTALGITAFVGAVSAYLTGLRSSLLTVLLTLGLVAGCAGFLLPVLVPVFRWLPWRFSVLQCVAEDFRQCMRGGDGVWFAAVSIVIHILSVAAMLTIAVSLNLEIPFRWQFCAVVPGVLLISAIPVSVGGWGVREGALVVALDLIGMPKAGVFVLSVLFGLTTVMASALCSTLWPFFRRGREQIG